MNKYKPAFPTNARMHSDGQGITKREYFISAALKGLCSNPIPGSHHSPNMIAQDAIAIADEILKQLESPIKPITK